MVEYNASIAKFLKIIVLCNNCYVVIFKTRQHYQCNLRGRLLPYFLIGNTGKKYAFQIVRLSIYLNKLLDIVLLKPVISIHNNNHYEYHSAINMVETSYDLITSCCMVSYCLSSSPRTFYMTHLAWCIYYFTTNIRSLYHPKLY